MIERRATPRSRSVAAHSPPLGPLLVITIVMARQKAVLTITNSVAALRALRGLVITFPWLCHLLIADLVLSSLLPLSALAPSLVYNLSSAIAESVWKAVQIIFTRVNNADITVSGPALPLSESAIVVANHVSWTDFYMIQALAIRARMLGRCRWFAKHDLKWVPFLGWGLWAMGMPLVTRNWLKDRNELDRVFSGVVRNQWPICMCAEVCTHCGVQLVVSMHR